MFNFIKKLGLFLVAGGLVGSASAFTLLGPFDAWQTAALGYVNPGIGGPQYLGNQYRWNVPRMYYAYDAPFITFFGKAGINAVEQAIAVFNALPPVSQMSTNLTEFPLDSRKINYSAAALGLIDLKSLAMTEVLVQLGTFDPTAYTWSLRERYLPGGAKCPFGYEYNVGMFNYDPLTWSPSAYVNNVLYTFGIDDPCTPDQSTTFPVLVNPTAIGGSAVADEDSSVLGNPGSYYTGLTRDDAGALRYLLSRHQVDVEGVTGTAGGSSAGLPVAAGAVQNGSPWNFLIAVSLTNATILGNNGSPWTIISFNGGTNATNTTVTTGNTTTTNTVYNLAGVEKITFIQVLFDSTVGVAYTPFLDNYQVTAYVGGKATSLGVSRTVGYPDLLFTSGDVPYTPPSVAPPYITRSIPTFTDYAKFAFNNGPGVISSNAVVTFSENSPWVFETGNTLLSTVPVTLIQYGSFDGSTNAPVVYPAGSSVQAIENQLFP